MDRSPARRRRTTRRSLAPLALAPMAVLAASCGGDAGAGSTMEVQRDTVGDTLVVRTLSGSAWGEPAELVPEVTIGVLEGEEHLMLGSVRSLAVGEDGTIFVMDGQIPAVRVFDADGAYRTTLGRNGGGPGEFGGPDGGMAMLSDGRLVVRDPGNARLQLFGPDLEPAGTWPVIPGGLNTGTPMFVGPGDTILTPVLANAGAEVRDWRMGLQRVSPDGTIVDTLLVPRSDYDEPRIEARAGDAENRSVSVNSVPFSPTESWTYHRGGFFLHGVSTSYRVSLLRPGSPLRIERVTAPVAVAGGEKAEAEAQATRNMRGTDPNWRWNGPAIPDAKPPFQGIWVGRDGRVWVRVASAGVERDDPDYDPTDPDSVEDRWSEPVVFDVYEADGTYLGPVSAPEGFWVYPTPVFDGDRVWAVMRDELDVQRVVRFRVQRPSEAPGAAG
jgi:hypothetical protein